MTERDGGGDPLGDFQRWLMKAGARSVTKDLTGRVRGGVRGALGQAPAKADVWDTATNLPLVDDEAPECAWCPVCRAARQLRRNRGQAPGFSSQLAGAGDALASVVAEAYSAFESAMKPPAGPASRTSRPGATPHGTGKTGPNRTGPADPWEDASRDPDDRR
ncbi:MAG: hypothetical protein JO016_17230 [Actinobacteria bacterium]|nr:hypothetical protein [Actinomycetota bacterium]